MPRASDPIGVFDSGVGGLSILKELKKLLPHERFFFFADQANVPYGEKRPAVLRSLSLQAVEFLCQRQCKAVVVACNTATCYAIDYLRGHIPLPIIGTVPAIKPAVVQSKKKSVAIIATPATAQSGALKKLVQEHGMGASIIVRGCHDLEDLVEHGMRSGRPIRDAFAPHARVIRKAHVDTVVLGCTHYPFIRRTISAMTGACTVDSGVAIARRLRSILKERHLLAQNMKKIPESRYWTTGSPTNFSRTASTLLGAPIVARKARL